MEEIYSRITQIKKDFIFKQYEDQYIEESYLFLDEINYYKDENYIKDDRLNELKNIYNYIKSSKDDIKYKKPFNLATMTNLVQLNKQVNSNRVKSNDKFKENISIAHKLLEIAKKENLQKQREREALLKEVNNLHQLYSCSKVLDIFEQYKNNESLKKEYFASCNKNFPRYLKLQEKLYYKFFDLINTSTGFKDYSTKDCKIEVKKSDCGLVMVKFSRLLKVNVIDFIKLIYETDYYHKWFPFIHKADTIMQPNKAEKVIYAKTNVPILSDRDFLIYGFGLNTIHRNRKIYCLVQSLDNEEEFQDIIDSKKNEKTVRAYMNMFGWEIEIKSLDEIFVVGLIDSDPKVSFIPDIVMSKFVRDFSIMIFDKMINTIKDYKNSNAYNKNPSWIDCEFYKMIEDQVIENNLS